MDHNGLEMSQLKAKRDAKVEAIASSLEEDKTGSPTFATAGLDWSNETPNLFQWTLEGARANYLAKQAKAHSATNSEPTKIESLSSMADDEHTSEFDTAATEGREAARAMGDERASDEDLRHKTPSTNEQRPLMTASTSGADTGELPSEMQEMDVVLELDGLQNGLSEADKDVFNFSDDHTTSAVVGQSNSVDAPGEAPVSPPVSDHASLVQSPLLIEKILQAVKPADKVWTIAAVCGPCFVVNNLLRAERRRSATWRSCSMPMT